MCFPNFSTIFSFWNISHTKKNWARCDKKVDISQYVQYSLFLSDFNPLNAKLNPICHFLALLGGRRILHVSRIGVNVTWIF